MFSPPCQLESLLLLARSVGDRGTAANLSADRGGEPATGGRAHPGLEIKRQADPKLEPARSQISECDVSSHAPKRGKKVVVRSDQLVTGQPGPAEKTVGSAAYRAPDVGGSPSYSWTRAYTPRFVTEAAMALPAGTLVCFGAGVHSPLR